tara:strand:- start:4743 stop:5426 length:684 start_codon:yes stop_codon:yes gene_type:complete
MFDSLLMDILIKYGLTAYLLYCLLNKFKSVVRYPQDQLGSLNIFGSLFGGGEKRKSRKSQERISREQLSQERDLFGRNLDFQREQAGEGRRRYDQEFGEGTRRYTQGLSREDAQREAGRGVSDATFSEYMDLYSRPSESITQMQDLVNRQGTQAQQLADQATSTALAQGGVRGPQAALERSRQSGMNTQGMLDQLIQLQASDEERRRDAQGRLLGQRSLAGLGRSLA